MAELRELLLRGLDQPGMRVADVQAADPTGEVDERVPVHVCERRAAPFLDHDRQVDRERVGDDRRLAREDLSERGPGISVRSSIDRVAATAPA